MASDLLLDSLRGLLTPDTISRFATTTGESAPTVSRALSASFPAILGGLLQRSGDQGVLRQVMSLVTDRSNDASVLGTTTGLQSAGQRSSLMDLGERLLALVFGDRQSAVTRTLAESCGIKSSSASTLLGIASPMVLAVLGDRVRRDGLDAQGLARLLSGQRESILGAVPSGLSTLLGLGYGLGSAAATGAREARAWIWPALLGVIALFGLWALFRGRGPDVTDATRRAEQATRDAASQVGQVARDAGQATGDAAADAAGAAADAARAAGTAAANATAGVGAFVTRHLPSNVDLNVPERGVESQVIAFVTDPARPTDPPVWFNFDRLTFETGSATLRPESREQLQNVAAILKSYPAVKVKIGGYTDNTGDPAANVTLSQARATNVMTEIVVLGVPAERITAEGYGQEHPVADNATEAGRAQNRRIAVLVTQK